MWPQVSKRLRTPGVQWETVKKRDQSSEKPLSLLDYESEKVDNRSGHYHKLRWAYSVFVRIVNLSGHCNTLLLYIRVGLFRVQQRPLDRLYGRIISIRGYINIFKDHIDERRTERKCRGENSYLRERKYQKGLNLNS